MLILSVWTGFAGFLLGGSVGRLIGMMEGLGLDCSLGLGLWGCRMVAGSCFRLIFLLFGRLGAGWMGGRCLGDDSSCY